VKKVKNLIVNTLCVIIALPFLLLAAIYLILLIPYDYIRYQKSLYYKNEKQKYSLFAGTTENFKVYNEIVKYRLPIKYMKHPQDDSVASGWFACGKTLLIMNFLDFEYDEQRKMWTSRQEEDDDKNINLMLLDELIEIELQEKNELVGGTPYENAVVWISVDSLSDIEQAKKEKRFLIYEKDRAAALRQFCKGR